MNILFVGAGGSGMGGLVRWHHELGNDVYLQDDGVSPAELLAKHPYGKAFDVITEIQFGRAIFSDAIAANHAIRAYAAQHKILVQSYAEELGALSEGRELIAIAGTHGKSTTTALVSWALAAAEQDPLCVIGAEIASWRGGFRFGNGPVVVEADEFRKHFLHLQPTIILITSLETDHFDTYADEDELIEIFVSFCAKKSVQSVFIARGTLALDKLSEKLAALGRSHIRFGGEDDAVHCNAFNVVNGTSHATASINGKANEIELRSATCPHVSNLLGAIAVLAHVGVSIEFLKKGIGSFPGILRRLELLGEVDDVPLYSDYAHHPTAVRETLCMLRKIFPDAKIGVIFEPHERLRTSTLRDGYQTAFADADAIGLLPVYDPKGRERPDIPDSAVTLSPAGDTAQLADYPSAFAWAKKFADRDDSKKHSYILKNVRINDNKKILVIMGAGPIDGAFRKFVASNRRGVKIYLLRHVQSDDTEKGINGSHTNSSLSNAGRKEAEKLIPILSKNHYDIFIASPLKRTKETIEPYLHTLENPTVLVDALTNERDLGKLTNTTREQLKNYIEEHKITDRIAWQPPQGEAILEVYERAKRFLKHLQENYPSKNILICGHQNFLRCLELLILGRSIYEFYSYEPERLKPGEMRTYDI